MNKGQALFEMVIVIGILLLILGGIVLALTRSIKNTTFSDESATASRYAQEAIEWIREQRDTRPWNELTAFAGQERCLQNLDWNSPCGQIDNKFTRKATLTESGEELTVDIVVEWQDSEGTHESRLTTILTNWRQQ